MIEIFFRPLNRATSENATLLSGVVKSIDKPDKNFFRFTANHQNTKIFKKINNTLFEDTEIEILIIDVTDKSNDQYAVGRLVGIEQVSDEYYSFRILLKGGDRFGIYGGSVIY
ncbi:hypothetical protein [Fructobacillus ficulneus]|uniref:Ferrodoxin oxidoreductase beta subunit n=1 Tax=Fructobacillus ficulneus TaxID=157463 RepID=A0A0K8MI32_9LACO|nr:hypothetical protein [Fructobacillus ficulneus]GAO99848.1 ferrodoxin oxidoreductase beta subunit [Fructobacillus ficulneus]